MRNIQCTLKSEFSFIFRSVSRQRHGRPVVHGRAESGLLPAPGRRAAIEGELVLVAQEVNPVVRLLRQRGVQIYALHNHMLTDQPHAFFLHTWSVGNSLTQARILRAALNLTNSAPPRAA